MAENLSFMPRHAAFDPETAAALGDAYDRAIAGLGDGGQPEVVKEIIAKRIVALAARGERNPERLCEAALAELGIAH